MAPHQYCTTKNRATSASAAKPTPGAVNNCFNPGEKTAGKPTARKIADPHHTAALRIPTNLRNTITPPRYGNRPAAAKPYLAATGGGGPACQNPGGIGGIPGGAGGVGGSSPTSVRHSCRS